MQLIGRGATSDVFALDDRRAIKRLHADLLADPAAIARFVAEADLARGLDHPNVVRVDEVGSDERGCFLVMERVRGGTLSTLFSAGPLDEPQLRAIGAGIAAGMTAVHARGIVHRDLKPANILLDGGTPKICDFGIAKSLVADARATSTRIGSPAYMAPEQWTAGVIAPCVDVWAFGVILFEAAMGHLPFEGFEAGRCPQLVERAPRVVGVSSQLAQLIARCLEKDPAKRPAMDEVARSLRGEIDERVTQALAPRTRRWKLVVPAAGIAVAIALAVWLRPAAPTRVALPELPTLPAPVERGADVEHVEHVEPVAQPSASPPPHEHRPVRPKHRPVKQPRAGETLD